MNSYDGYSMVQINTAIADGKWPCLKCTKPIDYYRGNELIYRNAVLGAIWFKTHSREIVYMTEYALSDFCVKDILIYNKLFTACTRFSSFYD